MFFIILCCYKPNLDYLRIQIDSIRAQTDQNFHCLIQDDLSPPDIYEKVVALVAGDSSSEGSQTAKSGSDASAALSINQAETVYEA